MFVCAVRYMSAWKPCGHIHVSTWARVWVPLHATGRHVYIRGVLEGPQTNRKQAFFIHPSILDACLTYEAWFGATLVRIYAVFFRSLHFLCSRRRMYTYIPPYHRLASVSTTLRCYVFTDFPAYVLIEFLCEKER